MNKKAFPVIYPLNCNPNYKGHDDGMDLRDYFAAKAMQGILSNSMIEKREIEAILNKEIDVNQYNKIIAGQSYYYADAMMERRKNNV